MNLRSIFSFVAMLSLVAGLVGCSADSGNQTLADKSSSELKKVLIKGQTTKEKVRSIFGDPDDTDILADGRLKWVYTHIKRKSMARNYVPVVNWLSSGTDDTTRKLVIIFKDNIVQDFSSSIAQNESKGGLLN